MEIHRSLHKMEQIQRSIPRFRDRLGSFPRLLGTRIYCPETKPWSRAWRRTPLSDNDKTTCQQVHLTPPSVIKTGDHHGRRNSNILYISRCRRSFGVDLTSRCIVIWSAFLPDGWRDIWADPVTRNRVKQKSCGNLHYSTIINLNIKCQNIHLSQTRLGRKHQNAFAHGLHLVRHAWL